MSRLGGGVIFGGFNSEMGKKKYVVTFCIYLEGGLGLKTGTYSEIIYPCVRFHSSLRNFVCDLCGKGSSVI